MKKILFALLSIIVTNLLSAQGLTKNGQLGNTAPYYVNKNGAIGIAGLNRNGQIQIINSNFPTVTTDPASYINGTSEVSGGNVVSDGGAAVTARGVCWGTSSNPTIASSITSEGSGTGIFISTLTGLTIGTTYYVRGYATNATGTAYGNEVTFTFTIPLTLGQSYQGGIIAYIFKSGDAGYVSGEQHGIIVQLSNLSSGVQWYNGSNTNVSTGTALGTGKSNTAAIIASQGAGTYAASLCAAVTDGSYYDWYLPSKDELNKINANRATSSPGLTGYYWSSSQNNATTAWMQNFAGTATGSGTQSSKSKGIAAYNVRAIRNF